MPEWTFCPKCATKLTPGAPTCPGCGAALSEFTPTSDGTAPAEPADLGAAIEEELRDTLAPGLLLLKALGHGGMGTVYLARDPALKRNVVVKVLAPWLAHDPTARTRFEREAQAAAAVAHPNVVSVFQVGTLPQSGTSYFVMQYVEGETLEQAFPLGTVVPEGRAKRIIGEVAAALAAAHKRGLVHRDIKPANVMLEAETDRVVVLDFGISAAVSPERQTHDTKLTAEGTSLGTPQYMSPEQVARERVTDKSDVYSLGLVAFELLAARPVFVADSPMALVAAHLKDEPPDLQQLRPDLDPHLAALTNRCLAKDPTARPSAKDVARALLERKATIVEWPPPGLDRIRGSAYRAVILVTRSMLAAFLFFAMLSLQPALPPQVRWVLYVLLATGCVTLVTWSGVVLGQALEGVRWARRSGYPVRVAVDVVLDHREDTASLIGGLGRYALLPERDRQRILRFRRMGVGALLVGMSVTVVLLLLWTFGVIETAPRHDGSLLGVWGAVGLFLPTVLGRIVQRRLEKPEAKLRPKEKREPLVRKRSVPPVRPELVAAWLQGARTKATRAIRPLALHIVSNALDLIPFAVLVGLIFSLTFTAILVTFGADTRGSEREYARWVARATERAPVQTWQRLDSIVAAAARVGATRGEPDTGAARLVLRARVASGAPHPAIAAGDNASDGYPPLTGFGPADLWAAWEVLPQPLTDSLRVRLVQAASTPYLEPWRRVARSPPLPPLWYLKAGLPQVDEPSSVPARALSPFMQLALRNLAAAVLAAERRDRTTALIRTREIIAVGRHLWGDPLPDTHNRGIAILELGQRALFEVGVLFGAVDVIREARRLEDVIDRRRRDIERLTEGVAGFGMARTDSAAAMPWLADTTLAPADRWKLAEGIPLGVCWSGREVHGGVARGRYGMLTVASGALSDIPRSDDWMLVLERALDRQDHPPEQVFIPLLGIGGNSAQRAFGCWRITGGRVDRDSR